MSSNARAIENNTSFRTEENDIGSSSSTHDTKDHGQSSLWRSIDESLINALKEELIEHPWQEKAATELRQYLHKLVKEREDVYTTRTEATISEILIAAAQIGKRARKELPSDLCGTQTRSSHYEEADKPKPATQLKASQIARQGSSCEGSEMDRIFFATKIAADPVNLDAAPPPGCVTTHDKPSPTLSDSDPQTVLPVDQSYKSCIPRDQQKLRREKAPSPPNEASQIFVHHAFEPSVSSIPSSSAERSQILVQHDCEPTVSSAPSPSVERSQIFVHHDWKQSIPSAPSNKGSRISVHHEFEPAVDAAPPTPNERSPIFVHQEFTSTLSSAPPSTSEKSKIFVHYEFEPAMGYIKPVCERCSWIYDTSQWTPIKQRVDPSLEVSRRQRIIRVRLPGQTTPAKDFFAFGIKRNEDNPSTGVLKADQIVTHEGNGAGFFNKLPFEIRSLIYRYILTTSVTLDAGARIEQMVLSLTMTDIIDTSYSLIDSTVMRTCRRMYNETLPVLYGENRFRFSKLEHLEAFQKEGLKQTQCKFLEELSVMRLPYLAVY